MTTVLPEPYPSHRHSTEGDRDIAQRGMILLAEVGSGVHGTSIAGTDDRDEMGVCIEPPSCVTGLQRFEQFERHTAWDRGGLHERSGPGDLDVVVYSARKFCRLALDGNPSILTLLFAPDRSIVHATELGQSLLRMRRNFISLKAADRYLGYLHAQKRGMNGQGRVNRPELIAQYGYDTKFAGHAVRLGAQGIELMLDGEIRLPMAPRWRDLIAEIRGGQVSLTEVQGIVISLEGKLRWLRERNPRDLPERPNWYAVDRWLHRAHMTTWSEWAQAVVLR